MYRKLYHLGGLAFPFIMFLYSREAALWISGVFLALIVVFDTLRLLFPSFNQAVFKIIPFMFKPSEYGRLCGSPFFMAGVFFSLLLFNPMAAAGGIIYLSIGDLTAFLAGKKFGRVEMFGKTLEGSLGFAVSTFIFLSAFSFYGLLNLSTAGIAAGSVVCAAVELLPL